MNKLVSIIIPTFNRASLLGETLESIIRQTYSKWECIVVDDGSLDYTKELMEFYCAKDTRIFYYSRPLNTQKGPNSCRNFGYSLSKGKFINWIDSDDILFPYAFEKKIEHIGSNDVSISTVIYVDENKKPIDLTHKYFSENLIEDYFLGRITFYTFTPLWRRSFLDKQKELFDERISNMDDWDFNLRMLYQKPKLVLLHEPLILYRLHSNSLSQEIEKLNFVEIKSEFFARRKHFKLLNKNSELNINNLREHDKEKCKRKLRAALLVNHPNSFSLFRMLFVRQLAVKDFKDLLKTSFGFISVSLFNKGDKLFK